MANREFPTPDKNIKTLTITDKIGFPIGTQALPPISFTTDVDTGIRRPATDTIQLVCGGIETIRYTGASSAALQTVQANVGLTADVGSAQGNGVITSSYNVYDTVGTAGDAATLPAIFNAGMIVVVKNGAAANSMDVFPASGDNLGAGANTQLAIAAKDYVVFIATTANATWEQLLTGTCAA